MIEKRLTLNSMVPGLVLRWRVSGELSLMGLRMIVIIVALVIRLISTSTSIIHMSSTSTIGISTPIVTFKIVRSINGWPGRVMF